MQLRLYRIALAAARFSSEFKVSPLVKMTDRGIKSSPGGNSFTDDERGQQQLWITSKVTYDEEFPPLSASIRSMRKSERRSKIDLGPPSEQTSEKEVDQKNEQLKLEASTSVSHLQNDTHLPTSFGKKRLPSSSKKPKLGQAHGETKGSSMFSQGAATDEPFDICLPQTGESDSLRSSVNEKIHGKWVPKGQSAEENEQHKDNKDDPEDSVEEAGQVLGPGLVLLKRYIPLSDQVDIVNKCRELGCGPGGFYRPGFDDGAKLRLYMMCLGLDWNPQTKRYGQRRPHDNAAPADIPHEFTSLVGRVLDDSQTLIKRNLTTINVEDILPAMSPDICIVNFYTTNGRLGLHQDRDESQESLLRGLPVVSMSVGDSAEFLYGDQRDVNKAKNVLLESGDVLIFGGKSRHIFHGVKTIIPDTAPPALMENSKLRPGRLNLTFRKY